jgi:hypothetical protein
MSDDPRYIKTPEQFDLHLSAGQWAWPGGYPKYFICQDGEALSFKAAQENATLIREAIATQDRSGWHVIAIEINYEDPDLRCAHSGERIESAYAEDAAAAGRTLEQQLEYERWKRHMYIMDGCDEWFEVSK